MFNGLGDRFKDIFKKVSGQGKLTEGNMKDALREVRLALLEADVNYTVAKSFVAKIREKALGEEVINGVNPTQQFIKIVNDELVEVLGGTNVAIAKADKKSYGYYALWTSRSWENYFFRKIGKTFEIKRGKTIFDRSGCLQTCGEKTIESVG